jgi:hypothetical protein
MADGSVIDPSDEAVRQKHNLVVVRTYGELHGQRYDECVEPAYTPKHRVRVECKTAQGSWVEVKLGYVPDVSELPEGFRLARLIGSEWVAISTGTPTPKKSKKRR